MRRNNFFAMDSHSQTQILRNFGKDLHQLDENTQ